MLNLLTPAERTRLIGVLGRLGSDFDGERAAAGLLATRILRAAGLTWDDLVHNGTVCGPSRPDTKPSRPGASHARPNPLMQCFRHLDHLSEWELNFVRSLEGRIKPPTPSQAAKLAQIADSLTARGFV